MRALVEAAPPPTTEAFGAAWRPCASLMILFGHGQLFDRHPLEVEIVHRAHRFGLAGASVLRGLEGLGASHTVHSGYTPVLQGPVRGAPMLVLIIDSEAKINVSFWNSPTSAITCWPRSTPLACTVALRRPVGRAGRRCATGGRFIGSPRARTPPEPGVVHDVHAAPASAEEMAADGPLGRFDTQVLSLIVAHRRPALARAARAVTILGEPAVALSAVAAAAAWRGIHDRGSGSDRAVLGRVTVALAAGVGGRAVLCRAIRRVRPPATIWRAVPEGASFPSKHTTYAGLCGGLVVFLAAPGSSAHVRTAALGAATVVGASRLVLGVHWPSDVMVAGALVSGLLSWVVHTPSRYRQNREG